MSYLSRAVALLGLTTVAARRVEPSPLCCGWSSSPIVSDTTYSPLSLSFYLTEINLATLHAEAIAVSDPDSPRYGDYLTLEEVYALTRPAQESLDAVTSWLASNNISHTVAHDRRVHAKIPLDVAAGLFNTEFTVLSHDANDVSLVRAGAYTLPPEVDAATAALFGLHGLPLPPKMRMASKKPTKAKVTPAVLKQTYDIKGAPKPTGSAKNHQ